jgi:hypothetical protein
VPRILLATEQIPPITLAIEKHGDLPVGLHGRRADEDDSGIQHPTIRRIEIVDSEEEADSPAKLATDDRRLFLSVRSSEQDSGDAAEGPHHHRTFRPAVVRERWKVFDELELDDVDEEYSIAGSYSRTTSATSAR